MYPTVAERIRSTCQLITPLIKLPDADMSNGHAPASMGRQISIEVVHCIEVFVLY